MDPLFHLTLALGLAMLFAAAALGKLRAMREWPDVLRNYGLLPAGVVPAAALALPLIELGTAAALLVPGTRRLAALVAALLLALFTLAIAVNLARGRRVIDCGCFGGRLRQPLGRWMVVRNALLALAALALLGPRSARALAPLELLIAAGCALSAAFLYPVVSVVLTPLTALRKEA